MALKEINTPVNDTPENYGPAGERQNKGSSNTSNEGKREFSEG